MLRVTVNTCKMSRDDCLDGLHWETVPLNRLPSFEDGEFSDLLAKGWAYYFGPGYKLTPAGQDKNSVGLIYLRWPSDIDDTESKLALLKDAHLALDCYRDYYSGDVFDWDISRLYTCGHCGGNVSITLDDGIAYLGTAYTAEQIQAAVDGNKLPLERVEYCGNRQDILTTTQQTKQGQL